MIKLSKTSKLDGILSWSLQARETCAGAVDNEGNLVPACAGCYATQGNYRYPNVREPRIHNREDCKREDWVADMVAALDSSRYFRWFDSGDIVSLDLAEKILAVMRQTPWVKHWLPTRTHKFSKYRAVLEQMKTLPNVSVRYSSDSVTGEYEGGLHGSVIVPTAEHATAAMQVCRAYEHGGKCNGCRSCWDKDIELIAYPAHGKSMAKIIRLQLAK